MKASGYPLNQSGHALNADRLMQTRRREVYDLKFRVQCGEPGNKHPRLELLALIKVYQS